MPTPDQSQSNQVNYGENRKNLAAAAAGGRSTVFRVLFRRQGEGAARAGRKLYHRVLDRLAGGLGVLLGVDNFFLGFRCGWCS